MASKPQSASLNSTQNLPAKMPKAKKASAPNETSPGQKKASIEKLQPAKTTPPTPSSTSTSTSTTPATTDTPRRKPRKLTREAPPVSTPLTPSTFTVVTPAIADDLEALKARVRGLEAKVDELCRLGTGASRSPRRRGKGRKTSSTTTMTTLPTLKSTRREASDVNEGSGSVSAEEDQADEELQRLETELEGARRDLSSYDTRLPRAANPTPTETDPIEEIPRSNNPLPSSSSSSATTPQNRHVTLSGSYRIPLPPSVSIDDVKSIQTGVNAAQNVARSVLQHRRSHQSTSSVDLGADTAGKQSWGDWIGGYSVAISRAVQNIEHEAAVEAQRAGAGVGGNAARKRRSVGKVRVSGEQARGLMS